MEQQPSVTISYFSDVLCVWAYVGQIRLDELQRRFSGRVSIDYHFLPVFGNVAALIDRHWGDKGGLDGYAEHVQEVARRFDHIEVHPELWRRNVPCTSAGCHLYLKAIQLLEREGQISAAPQRALHGRTLFEEALWRFRLAFFRELRDVANVACHDEIAATLELPVRAIREQLDGGEAMAALCLDLDASQRHVIEGSPSLLLDEGRQKLYGNVGYRIIEANIEELLSGSGDQASWC